ncbi:MAG: HlyC/CorC family transporter [Chthonomonadaceae bacterium]|nr:HlyC/CorC family transporter [Chthonomonadaceae bacterium]
MDGDSLVTLVISVLMVLASAFLVAAEYGLVGSRKAKIEALSKKGARAAQRTLTALANVPKYVAGTQWGITLCGIVIGSVTEPWFHGKVEGILRSAPAGVTKVVSILVVTLPLVVLGELVPKYFAINKPERVLLATVGGLQALNWVLTPFVWVSHRLAGAVLKPLGVAMDETKVDAVSREELAIMVRSSQEVGHFEVAQAAVINRALRFDMLDAADVMVHRLDINWVDQKTDRDELVKLLRRSSHSRLPVCDGDIDEIIGIVYIQDILRNWDKPDFELSQIARAPVFVPETLTLDRVIQLMREKKSQILVVRDEYGGTAGILTLEDVVEEVFGELEDSLEGERPPIERLGPHRITARAEVRFDELLEFLGIEPDASEYTTETLAEIVINSLERVPKLGDSVATQAGTLTVENMARRRVTRIAVLQK